MLDDDTDGDIIQRHSRDDQLDGGAGNDQDVLTGGEGDDLQSLLVEV